jgi:hypothetical protein
MKEKMSKAQPLEKMKNDGSTLGLDCTIRELLRMNSNSSWGVDGHKQQRNCVLCAV